MGLPRRMSEGETQVMLPGCGSGQARHDAAVRARFEEMFPIEVHPDPVRRKRIARSLVETGYLNVWEGAVRSSKTLISVVAFLLYVLQSTDTVFIMSGRTLGSLERNVVFADGHYGLLNIFPHAVYKEERRSHVLVIPCRYVDPETGEEIRQDKKIYCFGADNDRSYSMLTGLTAGGWYADEVNLQDRRFIQEAFNRTIVSASRKHFWTLNPDNPNHFIYTDYLDRYDRMTAAEREAAGGYHYWHFTLEDNPILTDAEIERLSHQYFGYAYRRFILGERCVAEGLVYPDLDPMKVFADIDPAQVRASYCAIDFGTDHPTAMYWGGPRLVNGRADNRHWHIIREYWYKADVTAAEPTRDKAPSDYVRDFETVTRSMGLDPHLLMIAVDPAAKALRTEFARAGYMTLKARNDVLDGINFMKDVLYGGRLTLAPTCAHARLEFPGYSWDPKAALAGRDEVIKMNDDAMDALRYFGYTFMARTAPRVTYVG